jgi:hypothetical protein
VACNRDVIGMYSLPQKTICPVTGRLWELIKFNEISKLIALNPVPDHTQGDGIASK